MLYGHELAYPIELTYLFLVGVGVLAGCIAAICGIIKTLKGSATSYPDYHRYWKEPKVRQKIKAYENSYAKSKGIDFFDWEDFLTRAIENRCTKEEFNKGILNSIGFKSCPSTFLDKDIPRDNDYCPIDKTLMQLECSFWVSCVLNDWITAQKTYVQIQDRGYLLMIEKVKRQSILSPILTKIKP